MPRRRPGMWGAGWSGLGSAVVARGRGLVGLTAVLAACSSVSEPLVVSESPERAVGHSSPATGATSEAGAAVATLPGATSQVEVATGSPGAASQGAADSLGPRGVREGGLQQQPAAPVGTPLLRLESCERVLEAPVGSLAIDPDRALVAALGAEPWLYDGRGWNAIALPAALRAQDGERDEARIHFGRDHQPRIMGNRFDPQGARQLYLRYRHGGWREETRELAAFGAKPRGVLYGVLGWNDPEVVCKAGEFCLIKQRSGWTQVPLPSESPSAVRRVDLAAAGAYALLDRQLLRLTATQWAPIGGVGPWKAVAAGAWVDSVAAWVAVPDEDALYRHDGSSWSRVASPVRAPRGLWGRSAGELWVAGRDGVGHLDARGARRVAGVDGPVREIVGVGERLWFGGQGGVWEARIGSPK